VLLALLAGCAVTVLTVMKSRDTGSPNAGPAADSGGLCPGYFEPTHALQVLAEPAGVMHMMISVVSW
jgi:hypothetical protein